MDSERIDVLPKETRGPHYLAFWEREGLSQKIGLASGRQKIFSFFNYFKKLQSNFLK